MKMAVFVTENAFCVGILLGCDLDENSCFPLSKMRFSLDFLMTWWHIAMANDDVRPDGDQVSGKVLYQSFLLHVWTYDRFCISHLFNMLENERAEFLFADSIFFSHIQDARFRQSSRAPQQRLPCPVVQVSNPYACNNRFTTWFHNAMMQRWHDLSKQ